MAEEEYLIKTASTSDWQMWLNQWKHKYDIEILGMTLGKDESTIAIKGTPK